MKKKCSQSWHWFLFWLKDIERRSLGGLAEGVEDVMLPGRVHRQPGLLEHEEVVPQVVLGVVVHQECAFLEYCCKQGKKVFQNIDFITGVITKKRKE